MFHCCSWAYSVSEDRVLRVRVPSVLANDSNPTDDKLQAVLVSEPAHGRLVFRPRGTFNYRPDKDFSGTDSFTYVLTDGDQTSEPATVYLNVTPANDRPVAIEDNYSTDEDVPLTIEAAGVLANDYDIDGDIITAIVTHQPRHGELILNPDGSFTYTPDANFNGSDFFKYRADDGETRSKVVRVNLTVRSVNDAPDCRNARAFPSNLRWANERLRPILILGCTDVDYETGNHGHRKIDWLRISVTEIWQDEPVTLDGERSKPDAIGVGKPMPLLRAERADDGDGRVYHVRFIATDRDGAQTTGEVTVGVPLQRGGDDAVDGGALYDSTAP